MSNDIKIHPIKVREETYDVYITPSGVIYAKVGDRTVNAPNREALYKRIMEVTKRAKVKLSIPFTATTYGKVRHGVATGIHATTGSVTVKWDDGESEQIGGYGGSDHLKRLTSEESAELEAMFAQRAIITASIDEFKKARKIRLETLIREATNEALSKIPD